MAAEPARQLGVCAELARRPGCRAEPARPPIDCLAPSSARRHRVVENMSKLNKSTGTGTGTGTGMGMGTGTGIGGTMPTGSSRVQ